MERCTITAVWDPPSNNIVQDEYTYVVCVDGIQDHNTTNTRTPLSSSNCSAINISIGAVNSCGLAGPLTQLTTVCINENANNIISTTESIATSHVTCNGADNTFKGNYSLVLALPSGFVLLYCVQTSGVG